jgi:hypothetical protein
MLKTPLPTAGSKPALVPSGEEPAALLKGRILELPVDFQRVAVYEAGFAPEIA